MLQRVATANPADIRLRLSTLASGSMMPQNPSVSPFGFPPLQFSNTTIGRFELKFAMSLSNLRYEAIAMGPEDPFSPKMRARNWLLCVIEKAPV
jgi:hypothetical protein